MQGQINVTKHTKAFISRPFCISLDLLSVGDLHFYFYFFFFFFAHGAHESVGIFFFCFCFCPEAEKKKKKKIFRVNFDGSVGKPETRLFLGVTHCYIVKGTPVIMLFYFKDTNI